MLKKLFKSTILLFVIGVMLSFSVISAYACDDRDDHDHCHCEPKIVYVNREVIKYVDREVVKYVDKIIYVDKEVIKEVPVEVIKYVDKEVIKEVPVIVYKDKVVTKEVVKEVVKEVPTTVEKVVTKEVVKEVPVEKIIYVDKSIAPAAIPCSFCNVGYIWLGIGLIPFFLVIIGVIIAWLFRRRRTN